MSQLKTQIRFVFEHKQNAEALSEQSWLNGKFIPGFYSYFLLLQQFILLNVKNVTLKLLHLEDVGEALEKIGKNRCETVENATFEGLLNGIVDTGCTLSYAFEINFKQFHVSPSVQSGYFVIVTPLSPDGRPSEYLDILGLNGYVWIAITVSIIALSFLLSGIKDATKERVWSIKKYVSHALSYIWYFTADLLQNVASFLSKIRQFGDEVGIIFLEVSPSDRIYFVWQPVKQLVALIYKLTAVFDAQDLETVVTRVRFLILGWIMASSVLMKCYSSNLKGELLVSTNPKINSIKDLVKRKDIIPLSWKYAMISHSIRSIPGSDYELMRQAIEQRKLNIFYENFNNMSKWGWNGKYAHFIYGPFLDAYMALVGNKLIENDKTVYVGDTKYDENYVFLFYNKNLSSTILERVDYLTTRFVETDQLFPLRSIDSFKSRKYMYQPGNQLSAVTPLTVHFIWPPFRIWIVGIASSILLAMIELISLMIHA